MTTVMAPTELLAETELTALETVVREGTGAFMKVGIALMKIRAGKGYRLRGFKTFEAYCEKEFGITDRHGRRLIAATEASQLIETATGQAPASESVARVMIGVANDPIVLGKVKDRLEKKHTSIMSAPAELVQDVIAAVTGRPRPAKPEKATPAPKPAGHATATSPALGTDSITTLQATLASARTFLSTHPWFKDDADAAQIVGQLDTARALLEGLLANAFASRAGARPSKPGSQSEAGGPPRCPSCKQPITPGETFCPNCGSALE